MKTSEKRFYLDQNGTTIKCINCEPGDKGFVNGIEYECVDNDLLRERVQQRADMTKLCTSLVTDMSKLFEGWEDFNQTIGKWDVSKVTNMSGMFWDSPFNQPIGDWDVSSVTNMHGMFSKSPFNQPIGDWNVSSVNDMIVMFEGSQFNQPAENLALMNTKIALSGDNSLNSDSQNSNIYYIFFDTETTGLPRNYSAPITDLDNWPRLVQLAYLVYDINGNKITSGDFLIKPEGFSIPRQASDVHGVTNEIAISKGEPIKSVLLEFNSILSQAKVLVAHNMSYDEKIIGAEFIRLGIETKLDTIQKICTKVSSTNYCALPGYNGYKWPTLEELHRKLFGTNFANAHNAAADIEVTAKCFWELRNRGVIE
jgi:DNA polymerase III subunit epsilon